VTARPRPALASRVIRDLRHRLEALDESAARVRAQRLRPAGTRDGRPARSFASDAEAVHDLRVAARRLTAGLRLWRPALDRKSTRRALRLLRRARRRFGPLREIEVHAAELATRVDKIARRAPASLVRIAESWRERYAHDRRAALERLTPERLRALRLQIEDALAALTESLHDPRAIGKARQRLADDRRTARAALSAAATADDSATEAFHAARIAVKKWRYTEERWHAAHGTEARILDRLRKVQEALGEAHDRATLREAMTPKPSSTVRPVAAAMTQLLGDLADDERAAIARFRGLFPPLLARVGPGSRAKQKSSAPRNPVVGSAR
jgi:CHAD domain-containing protein